MECYDRGSGLAKEGGHRLLSSPGFVPLSSIPRQADYASLARNTGAILGLSGRFLDLTHSQDGSRQADDVGGLTGLAERDPAQGRGRVRLHEASAIHRPDRLIGGTVWESGVALHSREFNTSEASKQAPRITHAEKA